MKRTTASSFPLWFIRGCYLVAIFIVTQLVMMRFVFAYNQSAAPTISVVAAQATPPPTIPTVIGETTGAPLRIHIPRISVDAAIEQVGIQADGSMGAPNDPMNAGWYSLGPRPGEPGNAVLDGHVNWWRGASGVFENLHTLVAGDTITIENDRGETTSFVVRKSKTYTAGARADDVFTATDAVPHLNIITCSGTWNTAMQQYEERLVIFADLQ